MIDFSFEKDIIRYQSAWKDWKWKTYYHENTDVLSLDVHGFYGCGKREFIRQLIQGNRNKDISYFSFYGLDNSSALSLFCKQYLENYQADDWGAAVKQYSKLYSVKFHLFIIDSDNDNEAFNSFFSAWKKENNPEHTFTAFIYDEAPDMWFKEGNIMPRSIVDYIKVLPDLNKSDIVRLHGLTGGIPAVAREMDADKSYEDNLRILLRHGSAFSNLLPEILTRLFRSPESYHPLMYQIALGKHRLSEIAKAVGFPNNKCGKYLEALIKAGLVEANREEKNGYARYYLTNSYLDSWYLYIYRNQTLQIMDPQLLYDRVVKSIDDLIAVPALHDSCAGYVYNQVYKDRYLLFDHYMKGITKSLHLKHMDGFKLKFDCVIHKGYRTLLCVFPRSLNERYTKDELKYYIKAAQTFGSLDDDVTLFVFSMNRFSDWCVHQAALNSQLFCVPVERLKY